jgi:hypothetical protein
LCFSLYSRKLPLNLCSSITVKNYLRVGAGISGSNPETSCSSKERSWIWQLKQLSIHFSTTVDLKWVGRFVFET